MQVFVSHAHADNVLCDRYVEALNKRGLDVWYDRTNMQDGHFLDEQISRELQQRSAFVLMVTPASLASYWVKLEVGAFQSLAAKDPSRLFLPVRMAECEMPLLMMGIKWIDAVSLGFEAAVNAMAVALGTPAVTPAETASSIRERLEGMAEEGTFEDFLASPIIQGLRLAEEQEAKMRGYKPK
jgi:TIR domain